MGWCKEMSLDSIADAFSGSVALSARNLWSGEEIGIRASEVHPTASAIKLAVLATLYGRRPFIDVGRRVIVRPVHKVGGSGVLRNFDSPTTVTIRDLAYLMIAVSDNTAQNALLEILGGCSAVNEFVSETLGLEKTKVNRPVDFSGSAGEMTRAGLSTANELRSLVEKIFLDDIGAGTRWEESRRHLLRQQYLDQVPRYYKYNPYHDAFGPKNVLSIANKTGFYRGSYADVGIVLVEEVPLFSYSLLLENCADNLGGPASEGYVTAGLIGRELLLQWWPLSTPAPVREVKIGMN